jgi:hypothetical protein
MLAKGPLRKKRNFKGLKLTDSPVVATPTQATSDDKNKVKDDYGKVCNQLNDLEIGLELRLDLRPEDFDTVDELGRGNGGTVCKVLHVRTQTVMARKVIAAKRGMISSLSLSLSLPLSSPTPSPLPQRSEY